MSYNASEFRPGDVAMVKFAYGTRDEYRIALRNGAPNNMGWAHTNGTSGAWTADAHPAGPVDARRLVVIDPDSDDVQRLADIFCKAPSSGWVHDMRAALREYADPKPPRCVACGNEACANCSRTLTRDFNGGECRHCSTYGETGMHWDTCPGRIRGYVFATRDEAMGTDS